MEYEIVDDPQGLPEKLEGDRDGGLREDRILFRHCAPSTRADLYDDARDEDSAIEQFGEAA